MALKSFTTQGYAVEITAWCHVKAIGKPCEGELQARFEAGGAGNGIFRLPRQLSTLQLFLLIFLVHLFSLSSFYQVQEKNSF